jgi:hypothetical protein
MSIQILEDSRTNTLKHLIILFLIALLSLLLMFLDGYYNEWGELKTTIQKFLAVDKTPLKIMLSYSLFIIPPIFISWSALINGKNKIFRRLLIHSAFFVFYIISVIVSLLCFSFLGKMLADMLKIEFTSAFNNIVLYGTFITITTIWNYLIARLEGKRIGKRSVFVLLISSITIPLFCLIWAKLLSISVPRSFANDSLSNGSLFFAFILYEGTYYLWLKSKL